MSKIQQDFFVAARAGSGAPALQSGAAPVVPDRLIWNCLPACLERGEGQALALQSGAAHGGRRTLPVSMPVVWGYG